MLNNYVEALGQLVKNDPDILSVYTNTDGVTVHYSWQYLVKLLHNTPKDEVIKVSLMEVDTAEHLTVYFKNAPYNAVGVAFEEFEKAQAQEIVWRYME